MDDDEVRAVLAEAATLTNKRWYFHTHPAHGYAEDEALAMTRANLLLGLPITGSLTSDAYLRIATVLDNLNVRVMALETAADAEREHMRERLERESD